MLTGQAKKDYQREYMRKRRAKAKGLTEQVGSNGRIPECSSALPDGKYTLTTNPASSDRPKAILIPFNKPQEGPRGFTKTEFKPAKQFTGELTKQRQTGWKGFNG